MKYRITKFFAIAIIASVFFGHQYNSLLFSGGTGEVTDEIMKFNDVRIFGVEKDSWVDSLLGLMTVEEKIGQLIFPQATAKDFSKEGEGYLRLKELVEKYKVGGFVLFRGSIEEEVNLINELQTLSRTPLLFAADFENGVTQRIAGGTTFPTMMALGAADDIRLTRKMGEIIAKETKALGIQQNYAPVTDVNNNPQNPIINTRSFGENPDLVARLSNAYITGLQRGGVIATSKHFPGHGNTSTDSHSSIPVLNHTKKEMQRVELKPFKSNISNGVMSIMVGHLGIRSYDKDSLLPASLSKNIISKLLKADLKFSGLIVTDALSMYSITKNYSSRDAALLAFEAGNDCLLYPESEADSYNAILDAYKSGRISIDRINYSVKKILLAKRWAGLDKTKFVDIKTTKKNIGRWDYQATAKMIAEESITLVRNEENVIPIIQDLSKKYSHLAIVDNDNTSTAEKFSSYLTERLSDLKSFYANSSFESKGISGMIDSLSNSDLVILSVYVRVRDMKGNLNLSEAQDGLIRRIQELKKPVVLLSHGNPYLLARYPEVSAYLCNYGDNFPSEKALAPALFGEQNIAGRLPVSIPNTQYSYGTSITYEKSVVTNSVSKLKNAQVKQLKKLDRLFSQAIHDSVFPGAVLLVVKDGNIVHEKGYGNFTYDNKSNKVDASTIYDLASVTKVIATTTAAMLCIDRGLFNLEDKVSRYLPKFGKNGKQDVKLINLLLHNSGLPSFKPFHKKYNSANQVIDDIFGTKLEYETGSKTVYSDLGMITLGKVIEAVTKKSLDKFCHDEIFAPLGMKSTFYNPSKSLLDRIAPTEIDNYWRMRPLQGEVHDEASSLLNGVAGHAGLFSTAKDLSILLQMLLQKGFYQGRVFIKKETVEQFTKRYSELSDRGIGWGIKTDNNSSAGSLFSIGSYGHTGYTGTSVWTDPYKNTIVILLTNRVYPTRDNNKLGSFRPKLHNEVFRILKP